MNNDRINIDDIENFDPRSVELVEENTGCRYCAFRFCIFDELSVPKRKAEKFYHKSCNPVNAEDSEKGYVWKVNSTYHKNTVPASKEVERLRKMVEII